MKITIQYFQPGMFQEEKRKRDIQLLGQERSGAAEMYNLLVQYLVTRIILSTPKMPACSMTLLLPI